jgi:hypothetical protein
MIFLAGCEENFMTRNPPTTFGKTLVALMKYPGGSLIIPMVTDIRIPTLLKKFIFRLTIYFRTKNVWRGELNGLIMTTTPTSISYQPYLR